MVGTLTATATAAAAAAVAIAGHALGTTPTPVTSSPFGGSVPVHIAHVGHIDVDLGKPGAAGLRRVRCFGGPAATACFVGH